MALLNITFSIKNTTPARVKIFQLNAAGEQKIIGHIDPLSSKSFTLPVATQFFVNLPGLINGHAYTVDRHSKLFYFSLNNLKSNPESAGVKLIFNPLNCFPDPISIFQLDQNGNFCDEAPTIIPSGVLAQINTFSGRVVFAVCTQTGDPVFVDVINSSTPYALQIGPSLGIAPLNANVIFVNDSSSNIELERVRGDGSEADKKTIKPGASVTIKTTTGSFWAMRIKSILVRGAFIEKDGQVVKPTCITSPFVNPKLGQAIEQLQANCIGYFPLNCDAADLMNGPSRQINNVNFVPSQFLNAANFSNQGAYISMPTFYSESSVYVKNYTISFWVNIDTYPEYQSRIVGNVIIDANGYLLLDFGYSSEEQAGIQFIRIKSTGTLSTNCLHCIIVTYSADKSALEIYIDNSFDSSTPVPSTNTPSCVVCLPILTTSARIGGNKNSPTMNLSLQGTINNLAFHKIYANKAHRDIINNQYSVMDILSKEEQDFPIEVFPIVVLAVPIMLLTCGQFAIGQYVAQEIKVNPQISLPPPDYSINNKLPTYTPGAKITHLDVWGEGRIELPNIITGFTDSYNLNKKGQPVSNAPSHMKQTLIPNSIDVSGYFVGFDLANTQIPAGGVKYMTLMGAPIDEMVAKDMLSSLDQTSGVIILYNVLENQLANFYKVLAATWSLVFEEKFPISGRYKVSDLPGKFGTIDMGEYDVYIFAPVSYDLDDFLGNSDL